MSDLLSLLGLGANGIAAQNSGVAVASNNISNANTDGYSRERVDMEALPGAPMVGGVLSGSPQRLADDLLAGRIRVAGGALAMSQAFADAVSNVQSSLVDGGPTLDEQLGTLFSSLGQVASAPTDPISRDAVVSAARNLVAGIQRHANELAAARKDADTRIRDDAAKATALAKQLAAANTAVQKSNDPVARDQRDNLAKQLSAVVGGSARIDTDGNMRFVLDGGAVLVDGNRAAQLTATPDPATGLAKLAVVDGNSKRDVTTAIAGGTIGANLKVRDQTIATASAQLDQLAYDVSTKMNATSTANAALDGTTGHAMFVQPAQVAGAAAAMALDPTLDADSSKLAVAAPGAGPGDNTGALALFGMANTFGDQAVSLVSGVAQTASDAKADASRDSLVADNLAGLRDSISGVDTQEEMTNLARFQNASAAMTKVVSTVDSMLSSLITNL